MYVPVWVRVPRLLSQNHLKRRVFIMSLTGKFQLQKNENFYQHLIALGVPEDRAIMADKLKPILEISIEGSNLTFSSRSDNFKHESVLVLDQEVDETIAIAFNLKSIAKKLNDHTIEIESTGETGERGIRRYEFNEDTMIMSIENDDKSIPVAKRYYIRLTE